MERVVGQQGPLSRVDISVEMRLEGGEANQDQRSRKSQVQRPWGRQKQAQFQEQREASMGERVG